MTCILEFHGALLLHWKPDNSSRVWNVPYNPRPPITGSVEYQAPHSKPSHFNPPPPPIAGPLPYQAPHIRPQFPYQRTKSLEGVWNQCTKSKELKSNSIVGSFTQNTVCLSLGASTFKEGCSFGMNTFSLILQRQSDISDAKISMLKVSSRDYREHFISRKWKKHILHEFNILIWPRKINEDRPLNFTKFNVSPTPNIYGMSYVMYIPEFTILGLPTESMKHV